MTQNLDPAIKRFLDEAAATGAPPITAGTVQAARAGNAAFLATMAAGGDEVAQVEEITVGGAEGALPARRYTPVDAPVCHVVFFHGGGWVLGDLEGHDRLCRQVSARGRAVVTHVNYRHAPEYQFPAAALDAGAAVRAIANSQDGLPLVVMGDSSGGNLAASAAVQSRDAGIDLAAQVLLYPVLDADFYTGSYIRNADGFLLTRSDMHWFWGQYAPNENDRCNPLASPLRAETLSQVAPAVIVVAGFDPLLDEAIAYADRLVADGSDADVIHYESMVHGFSTLYALTPAAEESVDAALALLNTRLANPANPSAEKEQT